ncbi:MULTISPECIES: hypothetical protein [Acinetobacter]
MDGQKYPQQSQYQLPYLWRS